MQNKLIQPNLMRWLHSQRYNNFMFNNNNNRRYNNRYKRNQQIDPYFGNIYPKNPRFNSNQNGQPPPHLFRNQINLFPNHQFFNNPRALPSCFGCGIVEHIRRDYPAQKKIQKITESPMENLI